jgi:eukaryotic-like serine/threonine-protein kinase
MDPAAWETLNRLLDEALELAPGERARWLETLPREHQIYKPRLEALLAHAGPGTSSGPLETLPKMGAGSGLGPSDETAEARGQEGQGVGPYRLLRRLGEGGMACVWLAERRDGTPRRAVALKLPHGHWRRPDLAERVSREREILASLNHPHIARLYDAGVDEDGQPYLALEYVEGVPIDAYAEAQNLDVPARLRLFLQVLQAIAHAHGRLVIHRDVKPSNILVTGEGSARLLDFGIAKILEGGEAQETELTRASGRALSLAYASPEQVSGAPLGVGSDVYSLGVVLFELLTGSRLYSPSRESRGALEDAVLHADPPRPSEVSRNPVARRALRGDLDTIVLKALKKHPAERYATANALAEDIERFLQGRPVLARPDRAAYRIRKFVGRNRLGVGAAALVALAVLGGAGAALWQARRALAEKERAEEVKGFVTSIFEDANLDTGEGRPVSAVDLLTQAKQRLDRSLERPDTRIELLQIIGDSLVSLQDATQSEVVLAQAVQEATALRGAEHIVTLRARLSRSWALMIRGDKEELRNELVALQPLLQQNPETRPADLVRLFRLSTHAAFQRGAFGEAVESAERALALTDRLGPTDPERLLVLIQLAEAQSFDDRHERARATGDRAHRLAMALFADNPRHPHVLFLRGIYAVILGRAGDPEAGLEQLDRLLADMAAVRGEESLSVGNIHNNKVQLQLQAGRVADAIASSERALAIYSKQAAPDSYAIIAATNALGKSLLRAGRGQEALPALRRARDFAVKTFGAENRLALGSRAAHALGLGYAGRTSEALRESAEVVDAARASGAPLPHPFLVHAVLRRLSGSGETLPLLQEALARTSDKPPGWLDRASVLVELGSARLEQGDLAGARSALEPALAVFEAKRKVVGPDHADALIAVGRLRLAERRAADALALLERADQFWRSFDAASRGAGHAAFWLGEAHAARGSAPEARAARSCARMILAPSRIPSDARLVAALSPGERN